MADEETLKRLEEHFKTISERLEDISISNKFMSLAEHGVIDFNHSGNAVRLHIPNALHDAVQRGILEAGGFLDINHFVIMDQYNVQLQDKVIYDIGANIGGHSIFFSLIRGAKEVIAFEPQSYCADLFRRNVFDNDIANIQLHQVAIGAENCRVEIASFRARNYGATRFRKSVDGGFDCVRLDDVIRDRNLPAPDFLKIDTEGSGPDVLRGAEETLRSAKPVIWIELWPKLGETKPGAEIMADHGYELVRKLTKSDHLYVHPDNPLPALD